MQSLQQALAGNKFQDEGFSDKIRRALEELKSQGVAVEAPSVEPQCQTCADLGMFKYEVQHTHALFGKMFPCPNCETGRQILKGQWQRRFKDSAIPKEYETLTLDSFAALPGLYRQGKHLALAAARLFIESSNHQVSMAAAVQNAGRPWEDPFDVVRNSLIFQGVPGLGKTGLAVGILNALLEQGEAALYIRTQSFISAVQNRYGKDTPPSADDIIDSARLAPVLLLDEFNLVSSDNRQQIMEQVIRERHGNRRPTLITCNATQDELTQIWGERTTAVLFAMAHWIPMGGEQLRDNRQISEPF